MNFDQAIESNLYQFYEYVAQAGGLEYAEEKHYSWIRNRQSSWPNWVYRLSPGLLFQEKFVRELTERIKNKEIPPFLVIPEPENPQKMYHLSEKYGLRQIFRWTGMAIGSDEYTHEPDSMSGIKIQKVLDKHQLEDWIYIVNEALFNSKNLEPGLMEKLYRTDFMNLFLGSENDIPVATSLAFQLGSVAGLYMIATLKDHRGKGYGTKLTRHAIDHCFHEKAELIILHASPMGENVYRKIGFREYCKLGILWMMGKEYR